MFGKDMKKVECLGLNNPFLTFFHQIHIRCVEKLNYNHLFINDFSRFISPRSLIVSII